MIRTIRMRTYNSRTPFKTRSYPREYPFARHQRSGRFVVIAGYSIVVRAPRDGRSNSDPHQIRLHTRPSATTKEMITLLALWRTVADAHAFFSSDQHQAVMRELYRERWQYTHFAALFESMRHTTIAWSSVTIAMPSPQCQQRPALSAALP